MGTSVGVSEGCAVGISVGVSVGISVGVAVGADGASVGDDVGDAVVGDLVMSSQTASAQHLTYTPALFLSLHSVAPVPSPSIVS